MKLPIGWIRKTAALFGFSVLMYGISLTIAALPHPDDFVLFGITLLMLSGILTYLEE